MAKTKFNSPDVSFVMPPEAPAVIPPVRKRKFSKSAVVALVSILVALVCAGAAGYFYWQLQQPKATPDQAAKLELADIVGRVGQLMVLPADEAPTLATVSDPEKLKSQPFFANAQAGDKVLIYTKSKKAILYRPSLNKILEVAPLNLGGASAESP